MEFKGTKTKWEFVENSIGFVYALNDKRERNIFSLFINNHSKVSDEEIKANALLISKAPEMLEMLIKYNSIIKTKELENLIKEATEI